MSYTPLLKVSVPEVFRIIWPFFSSPLRTYVPENVGILNRTMELSPIRLLILILQAPSRS